MTEVECELVAGGAGRQIVGEFNRASGHGPGFFIHGSHAFHFSALGLSYEAARNRIAERKAACMMERVWMPTAGPAALLGPSQET